MDSVIEQQIKIKDLAVEFFLVDSNYSVSLGEIKDVLDNPLRWYCEHNQVGSDDVFEYIDWLENNERGTIHCNGRTLLGAKCRHSTDICGVHIRQYIDYRDNFYCYLHNNTGDTSPEGEKE